MTKNSLELLKEIYLYSNLISTMNLKQNTQKIYPGIDT